MKKSLIVLTLFLVMFLSSFTFPASSSRQESLILQAEDLDYAQVLSEMDVNAIAEHIHYLSNIESRIVGYPGYEQAFNYVFDIFNRYLTDVNVQAFDMLVPIDYGANLTILTPENVVMKIQPYWPNVVALVTTPPNGISGGLIYVRRGDFLDFDNKTVEGSIVLMDFNSEMNWLNAAELGAAAVIFIQPEEMITGEAIEKITDKVPLDFPRFLIDARNANHLLNLLNQGQVAVRINCQMRWEKKTGKNIIGFLTGQEFKDQYILITAHYDSFSYVPSLAPSAEESCGISTLLEMIKFYAEHPPKYTLVFIAFSGTELGLHGSRWFVRDQVLDRWDDFGSKIRLMINLHMTTQSTDIFPLVTGTFIGLWEGIAGWVSTVADYMFGPFQKEIEKQLGEKIAVKTWGMGSYLQWPNRGWQQELGGWFNYPSLDNEPLTNVDGPAFSFMTSGANLHWGTPSDTFDRVNMKNLQKQLGYVWSFIYSLVNMDLEKSLGLGSWAPRYAQNQGPKYADLSGKIVEYDYKNAWYKPVPNAIFCIRSGGLWDEPVSHIFGRLWIYTPSDSEGRVFVPGVAISQRLSSWAMSAYVVNSTTGNVEYAPDIGRYGIFRPVYDIKQHPDDFGVISLFKCGSLLLFDTVDPSVMNQPVDASLELTIYDHETQATPIFYGYEVATFYKGRVIAMIYAQDGSSVDVLVKASYAKRYPLGILVNASHENPLGNGYKIVGGQQTILTYTPYYFAKDFYRLNEYRTSLAATRMEEMEKAEGMIGSIQQALKDQKYSVAVSKSGEAWHLGKEIYRESRVTIEDSINSVPFFALLAIPFAVLGEQFFFGATGKKRFLTLAITYILPIAMLYKFHPGFILASDSLTILLSLMSIILIVPVIWVLKDMLTKAMYVFYIKTVGHRFVEIDRVRLVVEACSLGLRHMKRRKLRSVLSLLTLILITWAIVSFTTLSSIRTVKAKDLPWAASRNGILIHHPDYARRIISLGERMIEDVKARYVDVATIAPRAWLYTIPYPTYNSFKLTYNEKAYEGAIYGILGLTPQEANVTGLEKTLKSGRWFIAHDTYAALISETTAQKLGAKVGDTINLSSVNFTVIGTIDDQAFYSSFDLDAEQMSPLDFKPPAWNVHLPTDQMIIVPFETCLELGGVVHQVALSFNDPDIIREKALDAYHRYDLFVYFGVNGESYVYGGETSVTLFGWQFQTVPIILVILILLTTGLGSVAERSREISVYSTVGLAPSLVTFIFLAETLVYAIVGEMMGYMLAMTTSSFQSLYLGISLNYSSTIITNTLTFIILVCLSSAIYPAIQASRLVTPSMERRWQLPKPREATWEIPLPFTAAEEEADALHNYIIKYLKGHQHPQSPEFVLQELAREEVEKPEEKLKTTRFIVGLVPVDLGVLQEVFFNLAYQAKIGRYTMSIIINHKSGLRGDWINLNRSFIDLLRKQLLQWRALTPDERKSYYN